MSISPTGAAVYTSSMHIPARSPGRVRCRNIPVGAIRYRVPRRFWRMASWSSRSRPGTSADRLTRPVAARERAISGETKGVASRSAAISSGTSPGSRTAQITSVRPRYLKLDRSLVTGIDDDEERAALVGALAGYSRQVGCLLVAEGVETEGELQAVRRLGVPLVQGFFLGRPGPPWPGAGRFR